MANLVPLGYQAATDEMAVMEPKVTKVSQGRLDPRGFLDLAETWGLMERIASKEKEARKERVDPRGPQGLKGAQELMERMDRKESGEPRDHQEQKGERGESGLSGTPGNPGLMSLRNWKECAWKEIADDKDNGLIRV